MAPSKENEKSKQATGSSSLLGAKEILIAVVLTGVVVFFLSQALNQSDSIIPGVEIVDDTTIDVWLQTHDFAMVEVYAPWCSKCQEFSKIYEETAARLAEEGSVVSLAMIEGGVNPDFEEKHGILDYPSLLWFSKDQVKPLRFRGPKEADPIIEWIKKHSLTSFDILESQAQIKPMQEQNSLAIVVLYGDSEGFSDLLRIGRTFVDLAYYQITNPAEFGDYKNGDIVVYAHHDSPQVTRYTTFEDLQSFISAHAFPPVSKFSQSNFHRMSDKQFTIIGVDKITDVEKEQYLVSVLQKVSENRNNFGFLYGDSDKLKRGIENAGATGKFLPTLLAVNPETNDQFAFDEEIEFNVDNVANWLDGLMDGTTKPFRKSLPLPEEDEGPVKTLVHKNFHTIKGKDAVVMYFAPWCDHCKKLAPIYEEIANEFASSNILFAKMDIDGNHIIENIQEIPTLVYYFENGSSATYRGNRSPKDLTSWISTQIHLHTEL